MGVEKVSIAPEYLRVKGKLVYPSLQYPDETVERFKNYCLSPWWNKLELLETLGLLGEFLYIISLYFIRKYSLTKQKVWEWYGKSWAIYGPYVEVIWEGWVTIRSSYGTKFLHGKESPWYPLYGRAMGTECPQKSHTIDTFVCPMPDMGLIWDIHTFKSRMLSIPAHSNFF